MRWLSRLLSPLSPASAPERAAQALTARFSTGETLRASLSPLLEVLVDAAVASVRRERQECDAGGVAARLAAELERSTAEAARCTASSTTLDGPCARWLSRRLASLSVRLSDATVRQHLVNVVLDVSGLAAESLPVVPSALEAGALGRGLTAVVMRSLSSLLEPGDLTHSLATLQRHPRDGRGELISAA